MPDILATAIPRAIAAVAPNVDAAIWTAALIAPMRSSGMTTPRRVAMFIGQCEVESAFACLCEDLDYGEAGLCSEWPSHFVPQSTLAKACARNPERLANVVYAGRLGNGSESSGDGWMFRGRGLIQITGRTAYSKFARSVGTPLNAAFLAWCETPDGAAQSACWWWTQRGGMNALADAWDVAGVTRAVNGALGAYPARLTACSAALRAIGGMSVAPDRVVAHAVLGPRKPAVITHTTPDGETTADRLMDQYNAPGGLPATTGA
jgi:putative chitinase